MIAQRSNKAKFDQEGWQAILYDIASLVRVVNLQGSIYLTGIYHQVMPVAGTAAIYVTPCLTSTGSTGIKKHVIRALRNGQTEDTLSADTSIAELKAYSRVYLGSRSVGAGDVLSLSLTTTGSPTTCTLNDLVLSITLNPT